MAPEKADRLVSGLGLPQEILSAWWDRRYLSGREPRLTYDFVGLALSVVGDYTYVCYKEPLGPHKQTNDKVSVDVSHWGVCRVDLVDRQLQFRGVRVWAGDQQRILTPSLWYSEFSYFKAGRAGRGELHWNFVHYPWDSLEREVRGLSTQFTNELRNETQQATARKEKVERRRKTDLDKDIDSILADYHVLENPTMEKRSICESVQNYLHAPVSDEDFDKIREDRSSRSLLESTPISPSPNFRGYVFSETLRGEGPYSIDGSRYKNEQHKTFESPHWCLSGRYVGDVEHQIQGNAICPLHGDLLFFRLARLQI
jgi:hypothetical protein